MLAEVEVFHHHYDRYSTSCPVISNVNLCSGHVRAVPLRLSFKPSGARMQ
jgi:hypothetical protein